ncbi:MAG: FG-GAP repeat domain-containing protein [Spirochaetota bacterium]
MTTTHSARPCSALSVGLALALATLSGCDLDFGSRRTPQARLDPPPGTYDHHLYVQPAGDWDDTYYWSRDPQATFNEFERFHGTDVSRSTSFRYFVVGPDGARSPILNAEYAIDDGTAPSISDPTVRTVDMSYYSYWIAWNARPEPGSDTFGTEVPQNPTDDVTGGWDLEYAVFSSETDNIGTSSDAVANGTMELAWLPYHELEELSSWGGADAGVRVDRDLGTIAFRHRAGGPGERRYFHVLVRDLEGNIAGYGAVATATPLALDIYTGVPGSGYDEISLNPADGFQGAGSAFVHFQAAHHLANTRAVALGRINDDAYDDLAIIYESSDTVAVNWFFADGKGTLAGTPANATDLSQEGFFAVPRSIAVMDMTGDGRSEIVSNTESGYLRVHDRDGNEISALGITSVGDIHAFVLGDVNGDGYPDVATRGPSSGATTIRVFVSSGGESLAQTETLSLSGVTDIDLADLNNDGRDDLIVAGRSRDPSVEIYTANSDGTLTAWPVSFESTVDLTHNVCPADFDRDGDVDLFLGRSDPGGTLGSAIVWNNGDGTFSAGPEMAPLGSGSLSSTAADLSGDGHPDVIETLDSVPPRILVFVPETGDIQEAGSFGSGSGDVLIAVGRLR